MPDRTKGETFEKRVEFKATDDERRVAIGGVLVPNKVDLQGDWVAPETIEALADGFMARLQGGDGDAVPGVMHAVFPEEHVTLAENRVLDEASEIGGKEFPAGSWIQGWKFEDDQLWRLVDDGVLSGYSIGATDVTWSEPVDVEDVPDEVGIAEAYDEDVAWEIRDAKVGEVSAVDIPAVPDAVIAAAKAGGEKSVLDQVDGKNEFVGRMQDRGASEDEAERLWHYLQRAAEEGHDAPPEPSKGVLTRIGKAAWGALTGTDDGADASKAPEAPEAETAKESRTLSSRNVRRLQAAHDTIEDALASEIDFETNRFTDDESTDFDVTEFGGKDASADEDASGGDTPGDTDMSDDDPDTPTAEQNAERLDSIEDKIDDLAEKVSEDDPEKDADDPDDPVVERLDDLESKLDDLAESAGKSQQLEGGDGTEGSTSAKADILGLPGGDN